MEAVGHCEHGEIKPVSGTKTYYKTRVLVLWASLPVQILQNQSLGHDKKGALHQLPWSNVSCTNHIRARTSDWQVECRWRSCLCFLSLEKNQPAEATDRLWPSKLICSIQSVTILCSTDPVLILLLPSLIQSFQQNSRAAPSGTPLGYLATTCWKSLFH